MDFLKKILPKFSSAAPDSATQQIVAVVEFINWFAYLAGIEIKSDWTLNIRTMMILVMNMCFAWTEIYTFYLLIPSVDCVVLLAGTSFTYNVMIKSVFFALNHKRFVSSINVLYELGKKNTKDERHRIVLDATKTMFRYFKHIIIGVYLGGSVYLFYPVYDYVVNGNLTPVSPLIFPFAADDTIRSFLISTIINISVALFSSFGTVSVTCIFVTCVEVYGTLNALIENDFRTFDDMWRRGDKNVAERNRSAAFRDIIVKIMELARYNLLIKDSFSLISTVQLASCFLSMSTLIFGYLVVGFVGGLGAYIYFLTELMMFCYIGQLMDNQNKRITMIISHSSWHVYKNSYQKDLLFALCVVQKLNSIAVAGVIPLNFEAGLQVMKNIYSITMFLMNSLE